jgi:hypothetical protein
MKNLLFLLLVVPFLLIGCSEDQPPPIGDYEISTGMKTMKLSNGSIVTETHQKFMYQGHLLKDRTMIDTVPNPGTVTDDDGNSMPREYDVTYTLQPNVTFSIPVPPIIVDTVKR